MWRVGARGEAWYLARALNPVMHRRLSLGWAWPAALVVFLIPGCRQGQDNAATSNEDDGAARAASARSDAKADVKAADAKADAKADDAKADDAKADDAKADDAKADDAKADDAKADDAKADHGKADDGKADPSAAPSLDWSMVRWMDDHGPDRFATLTVPGEPPDASVLASLQTACDGADPMHDPRLSVRAPGFPAGHALGESWVVIDARGTRVAKATGFGPRCGWDPVPLLVYFDPAAVGPDHALVVRAPEPPNPDARLEMPKAETIDDDLFQRVLELARGIDYGPLAPDPDAWVTRDAVTMYRPNMGSDVAALVSIRRSEADFDGAEIEGDSMSWLTGLLVVHASGTITSLAGPTFAYGPIEVRGVVDVDGDGVSELRWDDEDFEAWSRYLTRWDGTKLVTAKLAAASE